MARILIIDDDSAVLEILEEILKIEGHETFTACDGQEGMKLCHKQQPDLVITDIIMPEKEGIETILEIRRYYPEIKIIAISGGGRIDAENYLKIAKAFGAVQVFTKPLKREQLLKAVDEILET